MKLMATVMTINNITEEVNEEKIDVRNLKRAKLKRKRHLISANGTRTATRQMIGTKILKE